MIFSNLGISIQRMKTLISDICKPVFTALFTITKILKQLCPETGDRKLMDDLTIL